jgi:hypothetical protein
MIMTKIAYFDCPTGISGDMTLGALVDAGLNLDQLRGELSKLTVAGWEIGAERVVRHGLSGTKVHVHAPEQHGHRHLSDIAAMVERSALDADVQERALAVFTRLADAEAAVHGTTREDIHFHEVGALDAIVDIVGAVVGLKLLGVERVYAGALPLGSGWTRSAHGEIPIPAPATLRLLQAVSAPITPDTTPFELVTPTGAALLAELATWQRPPMQLSMIGYGWGGRDLGRPNAVRLWLGEEGATQRGQDQVVLLQTNIDDQPATQLAYVAEQLLAHGALDVWWTPIAMKKGRSATMLSVLVPPAGEDAAVAAIFRETTSLGMRRQLIERWTCERRFRSVETAWGPVQVKEQWWQGELLGTSPEYDDCARIAREHGVPLRAVYAAVEEGLRHDR